MAPSASIGGGEGKSGGGKGTAKLVSESSSGNRPDRSDDVDGAGSVYGELTKRTTSEIKNENDIYEGC